MRRRLDLAAALVHKPPVLFLDEPTTGLDPRGRNDLWAVIGELVADGMTLLLTTQYLEEAERLADRIMVIDGGRVIAEGTAGELKQTLGSTIIEVRLAGALVGAPKLLFLDEPTTGLDPRSRLGLWDVIRAQVREGNTLLLTTQYLEEADELADEIAVVDQGRIIARGTADELKSQVGGERIEVVVHDRGRLTEAASVLAPDGSAALDERTKRLTIAADGGAGQLVDVVRALGDAGIGIDDIAFRRPTLDDVFLALTGHAAEELPFEDDA
jgi:ABC-2 type transport system ATP-binding protein